MRQYVPLLLVVALSCSSAEGPVDRPTDLAGQPDSSAPDLVDASPIDLVESAADLLELTDILDEDLGTVHLGDTLAEDAGADADGGETVDVPSCQPDSGGEVCDGLDNDCDGLVDEDLGSHECGLGKCYHEVPVCVGGNLTSCNPMAGAKTELCNGIDDDCDGETDEDFPDLDQDGLAACIDFDDDGDDVPDVADNCPGKKNPLQTDTDNDTFGDLCDDDDDGDEVPDLQDNCPLNPNPEQQDFDLDGTGDACDEDTDADVDDDGVANDLDCAPLDPDVFPGQTESCNGQDDNCDELVDIEDSQGCKVYFADYDEDDFGVADDAACLCAPDFPYLALVAGDCSPYDDLTGPGFIEYCDSLDNDCDDEVDEGLGFVLCGKGVCKQTIPFCTDGEVTPCDPLAGASDESCDGLDNDCDGEVDEGC